MDVTKTLLDNDEFTIIQEPYAYDESGWQSDHIMFAFVFKIDWPKRQQKTAARKEARKFARKYAKEIDGIVATIGMGYVVRPDNLPECTC